MSESFLGASPEVPSFEQICNSLGIKPNVVTFPVPSDDLKERIKNARFADEYDYYLEDAKKAGIEPLTREEFDLIPKKKFNYNDLYICKEAIEDIKNWGACDP